MANSARRSLILTIANEIRPPSVVFEFAWRCLTGAEPIGVTTEPLGATGLLRRATPRIVPTAPRYDSTSFLVLRSRVGAVIVPARLA